MNTFTNQLDSVEQALLDQLELEFKYSRNLLDDKIWNLVTKDLISKFDTEQEAKAFLVTVLKSSRGSNIQAFIASIRSFGFSLETTIELVEKYSESGIYELVEHESGNITAESVISLDRGTYRDLTKNITVLPPMLVPPKKWTNAHNGGYLTVKHNAILGSKNQHNKYICLNTLNKLQSIAWKLNPAIVSMFSDDTSYDYSKAMTVTADMLGQDFYFMWQYDKRGRMYSKGYEINLQSSEYHKAMLDFAVGEKPTEATIEGLLIGIAEALGHDKKSWTERHNLALDYINNHTKIVNDELEIEYPQDCSKILLTKYVEAYYDAIAGLDVHTPVALDCTASGLQCLAVLTGCESTAKTVNIVNTGNREDVYTWMIESMNAQLDPENQIIGKDGRDRAKQALMTYWYGSEAVPASMLNKYQLEAFMNTLGDVFTGPFMFMEAASKAWVDKEEYVWTLPDGHTAVVRVTDKQVSEITLEGATKPFEYEEMVVMPNGNKTHIYANIVHSVDAYVARELVKRCEFQVATIHDSFWTLPSNLPAMKQHFKDIMQEIADSNLLSDILSQIADRTIKFKKLGNLTCDGEYMLS